MGTEITLYSVQDIDRMAVAITSSRLFGINTKEQAMALMLLAQAEGMHPATAARDYDIIQGRPAKKAEAMLRDFIQAGGKVKWHELTDSKADATFSHPHGGEIRIDWTLERAAKAGISNKDNFKKYPRAMLRSRCVSEGVKTVFPGATSGMYVPEEVRDFDSNEKDEKKEPVKIVTDVAPVETKAETEVTEASPKQLGAGPSAANRVNFLVSIGKEYGWGPLDLKKKAKERYTKDDLTQLSELELAQLASIVESNPKNKRTSNEEPMGN